VQVALVVGTVVCPLKNAGLDDRTLLLVQPLTASGGAVGKPLVATDAAGAGVGERVFYVRGSEAAFPFAPGVTPTDATIIGIVDHWHVE
jgi:ethanolamine utilization protein EutN